MAGDGLKVSNADRVVFPEDGVTKGDVVAYYSKVGGSMLPFVAERALTVERYPKGLAGKGFMQKNAPDHFGPDLIERHEVPKDGGTTVYPVLSSVDAVVAFANLSVLTFHAPPSTIDHPTRPDWAIWDLDPPSGHGALARRAALAVREVLESFGIETGVMTSGSNGYHLRCPLVPDTNAEVVAAAARGVSALAVAANPDLLTLAFKKVDRGNRVFVDWLRNAPYSTSVAPWSLRPRQGAPVATPISWEEIEVIEPDGVTLEDAVTRVDRDPWEGLDALHMSELAPRIDEALADAGIVLEPFDRFRS